MLSLEYQFQKKEKKNQRQLLFSNQAIKQGN